MRKDKVKINHYYEDLIFFFYWNLCLALVVEIGKALRWLKTLTCISLIHFSVEYAIYVINKFCLMVTHVHIKYSEKNDNR